MDFPSEFEQIKEDYASISQIIDEITTLTFTDFPKDYNLQERAKSIKSDINIRFEEKTLNLEHLEEFNLDCCNIIKDMITKNIKEIRSITNKYKVLNFEDILEYLSKCKNYKSSDKQIKLLKKDYNDSKKNLELCKRRVEVRKAQYSIKQKLKDNWLDYLMGFFLGIVVGILLYHFGFA